MEGRVEIFYNGEWGTVCDDLWDLRDAIVVCRQLGYTTAERRSIGAEFGQGTGRIWSDNVDCSGGESMLSGCSARPWGINDCSHSEDAGVVCTSKFGFYHPLTLSNCLHTSKMALGTSKYLIILYLCTHVNSLLDR